MSPEDRKMFAYKAPVQGVEKSAAQTERRTFEAQPVRGDIDRQAQAKDIMARYSKTIAYLAK